MLVVPHQLIGLKNIQSLGTSGGACILQKTLNTPVLERESYISEHVISYVLQGKQHITTYDGEVETIHANELLFLPRGLYIISDLLPQNKEFKSILFYFDNMILERFLKKIKAISTHENAPTFLKVKSDFLLQNFSNNIQSLFKHEVQLSTALVELRGEELLHLLLANQGVEQFSTFIAGLLSGKKRSLKNLLENNFDKPLKVEDYAYLAGRSLSTFRRDFKRQFSCTPTQWLQEKRLSKAHELLEKKIHSVSETAAAVGYDNASYFIKSFRKRYDYSPGELLRNS